MDLDGDGRDDVVEVVAGLPYKYRLANPDGTLRPKCSAPSAPSADGWAAWPLVSVGGGVHAVTYDPASQILRFASISETVGTLSDPLSVTVSFVNAPGPGGATATSTVARGDVVYAATSQPPGFLAFRVGAGATTAAPVDLLSTHAFVSATPPLANPPKLHASDFDGDGLDDVVLEHVGGWPHPTSATLEFAFGVPGGGFTANAGQPSVPLPGLGPVFFGDVDNDGVRELLHGVFGAFTVYDAIGPNGSGGIAITSTPFALAGFTGWCAGDLDGDGDDDVAGTMGGAVRFLRGGGVGLVLDSLVIPAPTALPPGGVRRADLDGDGRPDLVVEFAFGGRAAFLNQTGLASAPQRPGTGDGVVLTSVAAAAGATPGPSTGGVHFETKEAFAGGTIRFDVAAPAFGAGTLVYLIGDLFPWEVPLPPFLPGIWTSGAPPLVAAGLLDAAGATSFVVPVPAGLTVRIASVWQAVIGSPAATNGMYAASNAHELQI